MTAVGRQRTVGFLASEEQKRTLSPGGPKSEADPIRLLPSLGGNVAKEVETRHRGIADGGGAKRLLALSAPFHVVVYREDWSV